MPTAFIRKSFKTVCVDTVLFFAMFVLVGHLTINYWERYTIQNELHSMKRSLYTLKDTIGNIGKAYDNLHTELKNLLFEVDKKEIQHKDTPECRHKEKLEAKCKAVNKLDTRRHDFEVQTVLTTNKMKIGVGVETDNNKNLHTRKHKATGSLNIHASTRENEATGPLRKHAATNTKNPPKSTGTSSDISSKEDYFHSQKDFKDCTHVCHGGDATDKNHK